MNTRMDMFAPSSLKAFAAAAAAFLLALPVMILLYGWAMGG